MFFQRSTERQPTNNDIDYDFSLSGTMFFLRCLNKVFSLSLVWDKTTTVVIMQTPTHLDSLNREQEKRDVGEFNLFSFTNFTKVLMSRGRITWESILEKLLGEDKHSNQINLLVSHTCKAFWPQQSLWSLWTKVNFCLLPESTWACTWGWDSISSLCLFKLHPYALNTNLKCKWW